MKLKRLDSIMSQNIAQNGTPKKSPLKDQFSALRNVPALFRLIWQTNRWLMLANISLRLVRSVVPLVTLYIGKEIVDEVVRIVQLNQPLNTSIINAVFTEGGHIWTLVALELGVVVLSEIVGRGISLTESLLGDLFANQSSVEIIRQ